MYLIQNLPVSGVTGPHLLVLLLIFINFQSFSQSCDCPAIDECSPCEGGGLTSLTLRYDAPLIGAAAIITVTDKGDTIFHDSVEDGAEFSFTSSLDGEPFVGDTVTITKTNLDLELLSTTEIYTSCSSPIYVKDVYGDFTVRAGTSMEGGPICCSDEKMEDSPPEITGCPTDISVTLSESNCSIAVSWTPPTATDDCGITDSTSNHNPEDFFSIDTTEVIYTFTDIYGNSAICTFNIIVNDETAPVFSDCPASDIIATTGDACEAVVEWPAIIATDNCGVENLTSTHNSGDTFPVGTTTVTYSATDASGNSTTCSFNVVVADETAPVITNCPGRINLNTVSDINCKAQAFWEEPTVSDNCSVIITSTHKPGDYFPRGKTTVTYTATDGSGNTSTCSFDVIANDNIKPVISGCPTSDIIVSAGELCETTAKWDEITATDNCGSVTLKSDYESGDTFPLGKTKVTYTATDDTGNTTRCSFNVVITESIPPVISGCPSNINLSSDASCTAVASWTAPTATDNCQNVTMTSTHNSGDTFPIGTTLVSYTATDYTGNTTTCTFNVVVRDETVPVISGCPGSDITVTADGSCEAVVVWPEITATDNCGSELISTHNSGDNFPIGVTAVRYKATDEAGNTSICSFNVIVNNTTAPVLSGCPEDITSTVDESGQVRISWNSPIVEASCGEFTLQGSHEPGDYFPIGTTKVEYIATDNEGNSSSCSFNIILSYEEINFDIPKVVTPNGDGINDEWQLTNIEKFKQNKVVIVDRWGSIIFSSSGYNNENVVWRGVNSNGGQIPSGTYFYTISVKMATQVVEKRGFIELIK